MPTNVPLDRLHPDAIWEGKPFQEELARQRYGNRVREDLRKAYAGVKTGKKLAAYNRAKERLKDLDTAPQHIKCLHGGLPSELYQLLLTATRKPVGANMVPTRIMGRLQTTMMMSGPHRLALQGELLTPTIVVKEYTTFVPVRRHYHGYLDGDIENVIPDEVRPGNYAELKKVKGKRNIRKWTITLRGLTLLEAAAGRNAQFRRYFAAYCPPAHLRKLKAKLVAEVMLKDSHGET